MKFSCEKALLQSAILTASRAVSPKSTIPALEGLLLEAEENGTVFLTGYNQETGIRSAIQADVSQPGSMVLPARLFGEIVRKLPDDMVLFQEEALKVHIACGYSEFDLLGIDPEDFPELPTVEYQNSLALPEQTLRAMISQTIFAVSTDDSRPIHTGTLFSVGEDGLTMVAVDGFRLALRREALAEQNGSFEFVVPGVSLSEVEKICRESEEIVHIHQGARHILFKMGDTILISRRLEGDFLAWRQATPEQPGEGHRRHQTTAVLHRPRLPHRQRKAEKPPALRGGGRADRHDHPHRPGQRPRLLSHRRQRQRPGDRL